MLTITAAVAARIRIPIDTQNASTTVTHPAEVTVPSAALKDSSPRPNIKPNTTEATNKPHVMRETLPPGTPVEAAESVPLLLVRPLIPDHTVSPAVAITNRYINHMMMSVSIGSLLSPTGLS